MKLTKKLNLPIYDNPERDMFDLTLWNDANESIDKAYEETIVARDKVEDIFEKIPEVNAGAEVIDARCGEKTLGNKIRSIDSQLETNTNKINDITLNINDYKKINNTWVDAFELAYKELNIIGGTILIPNKIEIDRSIDLLELSKNHGAKRVNIKGNNWFDTTILKKGNFDGIILSAGCSITDLRIDGDNTGLGDGIWVMGAGCVLTNVSAFNHGGNGIKVGNKSIHPTLNNNVDFCKLYNIHGVGNNGYGLVISDEIDSSYNTSDANACMIYSADTRLNKTGGILIEKCIDNHFYSPMCEDNGDVGIKVGGECGGIHIYSPYIEKSTTEILLDSGSRNCIVLGGRTGNINLNVVDNGVGNFVLTRYGTKYNGYYIDNSLIAKDVMIGGKSTKGYFKLNQNINNDLEVIASGGASANVIFKTGDGTQDVNLHCRSIRLGLKDMVNGVRIKPLSSTSAITIPANTTITRNILSSTNKIGDIVICNPSTQLPHGISFYAICDTDDYVKIIITNNTASSIDLPLTYWRTMSFNYTVVI